MAEVKVFTASQIERMLNDLVEQINQKNVFLVSLFNESQQNVIALQQIMKSAMGPIGVGEDNDMAINFAQITALLSQRVALLDSKVDMLTAKLEAKSAGNSKRK